MTRSAFKLRSGNSPLKQDNKPTGQKKGVSWSDFFGITKTLIKDKTWFGKGYKAAKGKKGIKNDYSNIYQAPKGLIKPSNKA